MPAPLVGYLAARVASLVATRVAAEGGAELAEAVTGGLETGEMKGQIMLPVASEPIAAIGFDHESNEIIVVFKRGGQRIYTYPGSLEDFVAFAMAPSKGQYFNANFK